MGYTTTFKGELKFNQELSGKQLGILKKFFGEDQRDHPDWKKTNTYCNGWYYLDLEFNDDFSGIRHSGAEKTYEMVEQVNFLTYEMRKIIPDFRFVGELSAQGEDIGDLWKLKINKEGWAYSEEVPLTEKIIQCPHCGEEFVID